MIEDLHIRNLGVIPDARIRLRPGFTVLTGETGAGKTMVLTALALLGGSRADPSWIRAGATEALVEGVLRVPSEGPLMATLAELGLETDEGSLIIGRELGARSRAFAAGRLSTAAVLEQVMRAVVAVHGQGTTTRLSRPSVQRQALDLSLLADPQARELLDEMVRTHGRLAAVVAEIARLTGSARDLARAIEEWRTGVDLIEQIAPEPGEDAEIAARISRLDHVDQLRVAAATAHAALAGGEDPGDTDTVTLLERARRSLEPVGQRDPALAGVAETLTRLVVETHDLATDLAGYLTGLDADPATLAALQERRALLKRLVPRYGDSINEVLAWAETARAELATTADPQARLAELAEQRQQAEVQARRAAERLHEARRRAALILERSITAELASLAMASARVTISVEATTDRTAAPAAGVIRIPADPLSETSLDVAAHGADEVTFLLESPGSRQPLPISRAASGGELSRIMLAVEVSTSVGGAPTLIFDEVDAGVGGAAAIEIGRRLARLARAHQVIVVTHLAQVAAFADHHLVVTKDPASAATSVVAVEAAARQGELARMLSGLVDSTSGREHAAELLTMAEAERGG